MSPFKSLSKDRGTGTLGQRDCSQVFSEIGEKIVTVHPNWSSFHDLVLHINWILCCNVFVFIIATITLPFWRGHYWKKTLLRLIFGFPAGQNLAIKGHLQYFRIVKNKCKNGDTWHSPDSNDIKIPALAKLNNHVHVKIVLCCCGGKQHESKIEQWHLSFALCFMI